MSRSHPQYQSKKRGGGSTRPSTSTGDDTSTESKVKIAIGYCHDPWKILPQFHDSLIRLLWRYRDNVNDVISIQSGPKVDDARNGIVRNFLEGEATYLLMVDTDMILPEDLIGRLIEHGYPITGALAFIGKPGDARPNIMRVEEVEGGKSLKLIEEWEEGELISVDGTGAACILVHREVYEKMLEARGPDHPMPWYAHGLHNGIEIGEDVAFCLTARKMGYPVMVDTSIVVPHIKPTVLTEADYRK